MVSYKERSAYFRSRWIILSERDELAFSRVLREFSPGALFFGEQSASITERTVPVPNLTHAPTRYASVSLPAPGQEGVWHINVEMQRQLVRPWVRLDLKRSEWLWLDPAKKWAFDPPLLGEGKLGVAYPKRDPETKPFAMKLLRLVNKVSRRQTGAGLEACRWSQAGGSERRGLGPGVLVDPAEEIELNKYYDDSLWDDRLPLEPTGPRVEYEVIDRAP